MEDFGGKLRQARERRGISLRQIAASTKISPAALEALERNDISKLPGGIFSRAFVRSYAIEVGLDPDEIVGEFLERFNQEPAPTAEAVAAAIPEEEREFQEELRVYEEAVAATAIAPLESYLQRYPSGRFAELAQLRLDTSLAAQGEKPVEAVPSAGNPFTAGTARTDTRFRVGDTYSYRRIGEPAPGEKPGDFTAVVTAINNGEVVLDNGEAIIDLLGNTIRDRGGWTFSPRQDQPVEFAVGRRWTTHYSRSRGGKVNARSTEQFRIVGRESVTVPAGTFNCFRVEMSGTTFRMGGQPPLDYTVTLWYAPETVRRPIARDRKGMTVERGHVRTTFSDRIELLSFKQA